MRRNGHNFCMLDLTTVFHSSPIFFIYVSYYSHEESYKTYYPDLFQIMNGMAIIGVPPRAHQPGVDFSVIHGLRVAIEALTECSETQQTKRSENPSKLLNRGRVICITSARDNINMKSLENIFLNQLTQQNKIAAGSDT